MISDLHCEEDDCIGDDWFQSNDLDQLFICVKDSLLTVCIRIISFVLHYHDQGCCHKKYYAPEEHKSYIKNSMLKIILRWIIIINYREWYDGNGDSFQIFLHFGRFLPLPANVISPVCWGSLLRYLLQKSADSNARNRMFPRKYPAVWPTELHVLAQPTFLLQ